MCSSDLPVAPESPARIHGGRSRIWRRRRLHGALRLAWLGEEVAGDEAELLGTTGRRGGGGGYGNGERWRRLRSGALGEEREQGGRRNERARGAWPPPWHWEGVRGSRRWPAVGEVARARAGERRAHARPPGRGGRRQGRGGPGGLGRLLAGPACCCWAAQGRGGPGKSSFLLFLFSIFFLTFVLI